MIDAMNCLGMSPGNHVAVKDLVKIRTENDFIHCFMHSFQGCGKRPRCREKVGPKTKPRKAACHFRIPALHFPAAVGGRALPRAPSRGFGEQMCGYEHVHHLPALIKASTCMCKNGARAPAPAHITFTVGRAYSLRARHCVCLCATEREREREPASR